MKKYLFLATYDEEFNDICIVSASTRHEAIKIFSKYQSKHDDMFIEHVHGKSMSMCFAERFWLTTTEQSLNFCSTGERSTSEEEVKENIKKYFLDKPQYAELFINHYFADFDSVPENYRFPEDMLWYIYQKEFDHRDFKIFSLNSIPHLNK